MLVGIVVGERHRLVEALERVLVGVGPFLAGGIEHGREAERRVVEHLLEHAQALLDGDIIEQADRQAGIHAARLDRLKHARERQVDQLDVVARHPMRLERLEQRRALRAGDAGHADLLALQVLDRLDRAVLRHDEAEGGDRLLVLDVEHGDHRQAVGDRRRQRHGARHGDVALAGHDVGQRAVGRGADLDVERDAALLEQAEPLADVERLELADRRPLDLDDVFGRCRRRTEHGHRRGDSQSPSEQPAAELHSVFHALSTSLVPPAASPRGAREAGHAWSLPMKRLSTRLR